MITLDNSRQANKYIFLIIIIISTNCLGLIKNELIYPMNICFFFYFFNHNSFKYRIIPAFICGGIVISIFSCFYYRHQSISQSISSTIGFFSILSIFFFYQKREYYKDMLAALHYFFIIYSFCYLFQLLMFPIIIFPSADILIDNEVDKYKFFLPGIVIIPFAMFYYLNNYLLGGKKKYLFFFLLSVIMMLFRESRLNLFVTVVLLFSYILIMTKKIGMSKLLPLLPLLIIAVFLIGSSSFFDQLLDKFLAKQEQATLSNESYSRVLAWEYFKDRHFIDEIERYAGSGIPNQLSTYGKYMFNSATLGITTGYVDWGLIGYSWMFGTITAVGYLLLWIIPVFKFRYNKYAYYIPFVFLYILMISYMSIMAFMPGAAVIQSMLFIIALQEDRTNRLRLTK